MDSKDLRQKFLQFFEAKGHKILPSASLIPENDPSVLFTTAGMQQFKKYYLNPQEAPAKTIATCQPCIRTSDIDEVGDETHLTFFEMLGNFSFNDYFKKEAIEYAWEFLTENLNIDKNRIHATYFKGNDKIDADKESLDILKSIDGLEKIESQGEDNFWSLGTENSPGGPTVEFYVDGVEIWNLVFNEYVFKNGQYGKSEFRGVDTGMGLDRMLAVLNNKSDVYQTDLFEPIIKKIEELSNLKYGDKADQDYIKDDKQCWVDVRKNFRRVADHMKTAVFLITEDIEPSNIGPGYVLRRLVRRAMREEKKLKIDFNKNREIIKIISNLYKDVYPEVDKKTRLINETFQKEEEKFEKPLNWVEQYRIDLEEAAKSGVIKKIKDIPILSSPGTASGKYVYENYQSYGVPPDLSQEIVSELGLQFNNQEFEEAMKAHQDLSRTASAGMFKGGLTTQSEQATKYHTATHLLLASLRQVLGGDVHQKGSNITDERLRFDFSYAQKLSDEQIKQAEDLVNVKIKEDLPVSMEEMSLEDAEKCGVISEFGEKYQDMVKVYTIGPSTSLGSAFSREICGGPHVEHTGVLGHFEIIKEESSSAGVRRIKAILE